MLGAFEVGGKKGLPDNPNRFDRIKTQVVSVLTIKNPKRYAIVQVQKVIDQEAVPGRGAAHARGRHDASPSSRWS